MLTLCVQTVRELMHLPEPEEEKGWKSWVRRVERRRTLWAVWVCDVLQSILLPSRPWLAPNELGLIDLAQLGEEELWQAPTEEEWSQLWNQLHPIPRKRRGDDMEAPLDQVISSLTPPLSQPGSLTPSTNIAFGRLALTPTLPPPQQRKHARTGSLRTASGSVFRTPGREGGEVLAPLPNEGRGSAVLALVGHAVGECLRDEEARLALLAAAETSPEDESLEEDLGTLDARAGQTISRVEAALETCRAHPAQGALDTRVYASLGDHFLAQLKGRIQPGGRGGKFRLLAPCAEAGKVAVPHLSPRGVRDTVHLVASLRGVTTNWVGVLFPVPAEAPAPAQARAAGSAPAASHTPPTPAR